MYARALWIAAALLFVAAFSTDAQTPDEQLNRHRTRARRGSGEQRLRQDLQRARYRTGPFYLLSYIRLADIGYDDDIYLPSREEDRRTNDLTATIAAPQKLYFVPSRKFALSAEVEPSYVWFRKNDDERRWNHRYRGDAHWMLNHLYVDLYGATSKERKRSLADFNQRVTHERDEFGIYSELNLSSRTNITASVRHHDLQFPVEEDTFEEQRARLLERKELISTVHFLHRTFGATGIGTNIQLGDYDFETDQNRDASERRLSLVLNREKEIHQFNLSVGHASLIYRVPEHRDFNGVVGSAVWGWDPRRNLHFDSRVSRDVQFSVFGQNNHLVFERYRVSGTWTGPRRIDFHLVSEIGRNHYPVPAFDALDQRIKKRKDTIEYTSVGFLAPVTRLARAGLDVGFYERESNFSAYVDRGIRFVLRLSISP